MRSCIDRSYVVTAVSLLLLHLAGVASSERLRGVCKEGCLDLSDEQSCEAEESLIPDELPAIVDTSDSYRSSCQSCRTSNCLAPDSSTPELNIGLQHYSNTEFGIAVTWEFSENVTNNVTAVYLILSERLSDVCSEVPRQTIQPFHYQCVSFDSTEPNIFRFTYDYRLSNPPFKVKPHLYVKVISYFRDGCNTITTERVTVPRNCHTVLPGNCSVCGENGDYIPRPGGIAVSPCQRMSDGIWEVSISWDTETYPCEHCIYYLNIFNEHNETVAQLKVLGERANVTVQGLPAQQTYSVQLQLYECQCVNSSDTVPFFLGSPLHPTPSTQLYTSSMMSITMVEKLASVSSLCPTTSSPPSRMTSTQVVQNSTPIPTSTPTSLASTGTGDAVRFVAIFVPVGIMIVVVTIVAVLVVVMCRIFNRPPKQKHSQEEDSSEAIRFSPELESEEHNTEFESPKRESDPGNDFQLAAEHSKEEDSPKAMGFPSELASKEQDSESEPQRESDSGSASRPTAHSIPETDSKPDRHYKVLVVYSSLTPKNQEASIHRFMAKLCCHKIEPHFSQKGLCRRRIVEWIQQKIVECDAVICICNEQFRHEWDDRRFCHNSPVRFVREIVYGNISLAKPNNLLKYVLMTIQPSDAQDYIPSYIGSCKICSPLDSNTAVDDVVRFIKNIPRYQFQSDNTNR